MPLDNKDLVEAVKAKREREGLSIRALASLVGVSFSSLARIERGDGAPDNNSQIRLLEWLGPDGREAGLSFEDVAYVHFRAGKNASSRTIQCLLKASEIIRFQEQFGSDERYEPDESNHFQGTPSSIPLSKEEMEEMSLELRQDLGLGDNDPLDSLKIVVEGVTVCRPSTLSDLPRDCESYLRTQGCGDWSAMSVPLDSNGDRWTVFLNEDHDLRRQRVTILEEYWHIMLGHKLTKIAKISGSFGRTYDSAEEHDAYYLASASLLPRKAILDAVKNGRSAEEIANWYGVSPALADYRIKRLGLWRLHRNVSVKLES